MEVLGRPWIVLPRSAADMENLSKHDKAFSAILHPVPHALILCHECLYCLSWLAMNFLKL